MNFHVQKCNSKYNRNLTLRQYLKQLYYSRFSANSNCHVFADTQLACKKALFWGCEFCEFGSSARAAANSEPLSGRAKGARISTSPQSSSYSAQGATSSPGPSPRRFSKWRLKSREGPGNEVAQGERRERWVPRKRAQGEMGRETTNSEFRPADQPSDL